MTFEEIRKDIKARKYKPIYFLCGEEPFFIDRLTALLENTVLTEDEKAFNQTVLYGNDVSMSTITDTARRFPMMSERQVVIVGKLRISGTSTIYYLISIITKIRPFWSWRIK